MDLDIITSEQMSKARILIVDDVELNRKMLTHNLQAHGYKNLHVAEDGSKALQMTQAEHPDLVILDLMMPNMDGFSYCQKVRSDKRYEDMPILVQTALDDMDKKLRAFELGASDYICKPVDPGELIARTKVHLSQKFLMESLREYHKRMSAELEAARAMQGRLLPSPHQIQMYERVFDMKISYHFETSTGIGGDCWGMRPLSDTRLAVWMYDFSGHGITAAMNVFRMHTIMQDISASSGDPGAFLSALNRGLYPLLERNEFATMFYGVIDTEANCLQYATAAAPAALIFRCSGQEPATLASRSLPLGAIPNTAYETKYVSFSQGELLLLHSDSIIESKGKQNDFLDEGWLKTISSAAISEAPQNPAHHTTDAVMRLFNVHNMAPATDDVTVTAYWRCLHMHTPST